MFAATIIRAIAPDKPSSEGEKRMWNVAEGGNKGKRGEVSTVPY